MNNFFNPHHDIDEFHVENLEGRDAAFEPRCFRFEPGWEDILDIQEDFFRSNIVEVHDHIMKVMAEADDMKTQYVRRREASRKLWASIISVVGLKNN